MMLKLVVRSWENDWYTIQRWVMEGEHREWMERVDEHGMTLRDSTRISDADIEGYLVEFKQLAQAIRSRGSAHFKRCAVEVIGEYAYFWSPRNSQIRAGVHLDVADDLATQIEALA